MAGASPDTTDGRIKRSERSRTAIIDAMVELIDAGSMMPTAEKVAERAGVGIRTVFRHFSDMETLFAATVDRTGAVDELVIAAHIGSGTLEQRVSGLVLARCDFYERYGNRVRSMELVRWRSAAMEGQARFLARSMRKLMFDSLPEVAHADRSTQDALEAILSFTYWDQLRRQQRSSAKRARAAVEAAALALVAGLETR